MVDFDILFIDDRTLLRGVVESTPACGISDPRLYSVWTSFKPVSDGLAIESDCSCESFGCQHLSALLTHYERASLVPRNYFTKSSLDLSDISYHQNQDSTEVFLTRNPSSIQEERIFYVLNPSLNPPSLSIELVVMVGLVKPNQIPQKLRPLRQNVLNNGCHPDYLTPEDQEIIEQLLASPLNADADFRFTGSALENENLYLLFKRLVATGRLVQNPDHSLITQWAETREASGRWYFDHNCHIRFSVVAPPHPYTVFTAGRLLWHDPDAHSLGDIKMQVDPAALLELLALPGMDLERLETWRQQRDDAYFHQANLPKPPRIVELIEVEPRIVFRFENAPADFPAMDVGVNGPIPAFRNDPHHPVVHILAEYSGHRLPLFPFESISLIPHPEGQFSAIKRNAGKEWNSATHLHYQGFCQINNLWSRPVKNKQQLLRCWHYLLTRLSELHAVGIITDFAPDFCLPAQELIVWNIETDSADNTDTEGEATRPWSIEISVTVDDHKVNLIPFLAKWFRRSSEQQNDPFWVPLPDGRDLLIPSERVALILETLFGIFDQNSPNARRYYLSSSQLPLLESLRSRFGGKLDWKLGQTVACYLTSLRKAQTDPVADLPKGLQANLRPYQVTGLGWLQFLYRNALGGILADDMGLGKTLQTIAFILSLKEQGKLNRPGLIVVPTTLLFNWKSEIEHFAPALNALIFHGSDRHDNERKCLDVDIILTSYNLLIQDESLHKIRHYTFLVLDESHRIKNPKAAVTQILFTLKADFKLCLTGTPIENHLRDLWSQFHFLMPELLGSQRRYSQLFGKNLQAQIDATKMETLSAIVNPFILRRTKNEVMQELPPKTEITRLIDLGPEQSELYETVRLAMSHEVRSLLMTQGKMANRIRVITALLRLRQVCCDPRLLKGDVNLQNKPSAKLELLLEMLQEMVEEGRRILVFSQFSEMLALIETQLTLLGIPFLKLTGETGDRKKCVAAFQNGEAPVFLITLKTGGIGLNLTAADVVIHYDPWWNPSAENQATDRAYRIGQTRPVFCYKLIVAGSIEEYIQRMQSSKQTLATGILQTDQPELQWSHEQLEELLAPLAHWCTPGKRRSSNNESAA